MLGIRYLVSGIGYQVFGIRYWVSGIGYQVLGIRYSYFTWGTVRHRLFKVPLYSIYSFRKFKEYLSNSYNIIRKIILLHSCSMYNYIYCAIIA